MPPLRHRSRHLRATIVNKVTADLTALGWVTAPINFGTDAVRIIDYPPEERGEVVTVNTVAVSLGDVLGDADEELGAQEGGLRSCEYPIFIDVFMDEQSFSDALCDDLRDSFDQQIIYIVDQITGLPTAEFVDIEECLGPDRPVGGGGTIDTFKRTWRIMRLVARLYYQS